MISSFRSKSRLSQILILCNCFVCLCASASAPALQGTDFTSVTNSVPAVIDSGPVIVTSTITVSGAQPVIFDLDVQTFITHTYGSDLDITLQSPAGTIVTLSTDNGASYDNVFNGTVWDDDANPAGTLPYETNDGLVTDRAYADMVTASPLVPEEALAAFNGEDPNGTWTLTVSDDTIGDGGSLNSWTLDITTLPAAIALPPALSASNNAAVPITDAAVTTSTMVLAGAGTFLFDVNVTVNITHSVAAHLDITLTSPAGTVVTLTTDNGSDSANVFSSTTWDDSADPDGPLPYTANDGLTTDETYYNQIAASPMVPEEAMGAFIGEDPNGTWTLTISDDFVGFSGTLNSWSIEVIAKSPILKVTKPQKDQQVKRNRNIKVVWKTEGNVGENVGIELWKNGSLVSTLSAMTKNDGRQKVKIPADTVIGGGYQIRVNSLTTASQSLSKKFRIVNP